MLLFGVHKLVDLSFFFRNQGHLLCGAVLLLKVLNRGLQAGYAALQFLGEQHALGVGQPFKHVRVNLADVHA